MQTLVDDFICALRRRVLYQGRMYVFEHYLCFYSNIFGHLKIVTIPLKVSYPDKPLYLLYLQVASKHLLCFDKEWQASHVGISLQKDLKTPLLAHNSCPGKN